MTMRRASGLTCASLLLLLLVPSPGMGGRWLASSDRIDDAAFWRMFSEFSEPSGFFQSDNLVSNETTFPDLLPEIAKRASATSAYVGVGPEQNFSYIAALQPRIAFIVDIRRQNAILHLLYKALFEISGNRAEFLSRLFCRPRPAGLDSRASASALLEAFANVRPNARFFEKNLEKITRHLTEKHRFTLTDEDVVALKYVYTAFFDAGPDLQYSFGSGRRGRPFPTFAELMSAVDEKGVAGSFLATEENYRNLQEMQRRNLIIPVVGNFLGNRALKAVGSYIESRGFKVAVFYTSNVESYLFRGDDWRAFYDNVALFPVDRDSVLVRSVFGGFGPFGGGFSGAAVPGVGYSRGRRGSLHLDPIETLGATVRSGGITNYGDIVARSK